MAYSPAWVYKVVETSYLTADALLRKYVTCATGCFCDINGQEGGKYI